MSTTSSEHAKETSKGEEGEYLLIGGNCGCTRLLQTQATWGAFATPGRLKHFGQLCRNVAIRLAG
jgi:hypothetical protein